VITVITEKYLSDVVGKTAIVYLEDPELAAKVPTHIEKLEPSDYIGEEPDISDDDVESEFCLMYHGREYHREGEEMFSINLPWPYRILPSHSSLLLHIL
jgi:hypothetical protein